MSGGKLEVQIGADKTDFDKKIKKVEYDIKELSKIKLDQLKLGIDTTQINSQIKVAKNNLNQLKTAVRDTGQAFSKDLAPKIANGGNVLNQFSRIAQDAPYGIIGIGNNITATAESFSYLKNQTGSTGGALKALASSITGTGGILLGVSLLTTGLTYLAQSGLTFQDVVDKLTGKTDEYKQALKSVNDEAYGSKSVQEAVSNVSTLTNEIKLAKEGFLSKDKVVEHYNETIGKTTGLVKSIEEAEKALTESGDAYIKMTIYKAAANIASEAAAKNLLDAERTRVKKLAEFTSAFLDADLTQTRSKEQYDQKQKDLAQRQKNRQNEEIKLNADAAKINLSIFKKFQNDAAAIAKQFKFNFFGDNEKAKDVKAKEIKFKFKVDPSVKSELNTFVSELGTGFKFTSPLLQLNLFPDGLTDEERAKKEKIKAALDEFNSEVKDIIQNSISSTFQGLGTAIGDAFANGGNVLQSVGKSLLSSLGSVLVEMGKMAIQIGVGLIAVKLALKTLNPYAAIGAGVALIALGTFFSSKSASIGNSNGGGGGASTATGSGANNSSFTSGGFSANSGGGTVVFEISGQKLIGVLSNTLNGNRRLGGALGLG